MRPPIVNTSRYGFCNAYVDSEGRLFADARKPYRYRAFADNRTHVVNEGDTLYNLAGYYYQRTVRGAGLWWVIADFQPIPIVDPTIQLTPGSVLIIPTLRTVLSEIFSESRRNESRL